MKHDCFFHWMECYILFTWNGWLRDKEAVGMFIVNAYLFAEFRMQQAPNPISYCCCFKYCLVPWLVSGMLGSWRKNGKIFKVTSSNLCDILFVGVKFSNRVIESLAYRLSNDQKWFMMLMMVIIWMLKQINGDRL